MLTPIIDDLAKEYAGKVKVTKVNVDDNQELAAKFGIRGIPTIMVFKGGEAVSTLVGMQPKEQLAKALDDAL
jgi:thioredoxin 1